MRKHICMLFVVIAVLCAFLTTAPKVEAAPTKLTANATSRSFAKDTTLDLNGYTIDSVYVSSGVTVTVMDSQTDDYDSGNDAYGKIKKITGTGTVVAADGYLLLKEQGATSFHKVSLEVSDVALRATGTDNTEAGMYYRCTFGGDMQVKNSVVAYGVALGAGKMPEYLYGTYTRMTNVSAVWQTGKAFVSNSGLLKGILKPGNTRDINLRNSDMDIYCQPYVELADGSKITGETVAFSLRDLMEGTDALSGVDRNFATLNATAQTAAKALYQTYFAIMDPWHIPQIRQAVAGGAYEIRSEEEIYVLWENPNADHKLMNDLDLSGVAWPLLDTFSGTFDGNGKEISNLKVTAGTGLFIGMFNKVSETGVIKDLHLRDITVDGRRLATIRYLGTIAGWNKGQITDCSVTGMIIDNKTGTESAYIFVGALAGRSEAGSFTGGSGLTVTQQVTDVLGQTKIYTTEGLAAQVCMNVPDSEYVMRRLVGNPLGGTATMSGIWQDLSFSTRYEDAELQRRRQVVVDDVYAQGTLKWTPATEIRYYDDQATNSSFNNSRSHIHNQRFIPGTTYVGIPYTHCASPLEQAKFYMQKNEDGSLHVNENDAFVLDSSVTTLMGGNKKVWENRKYVYKQEIGSADWSSTADSKNPGFDPNNIGWGKYFGSDCSGALTTAWHKVSPILTSTKDNGGVSLLYTNNMVPSQYNQWYYGFRQVGNYQVDDAAWSGNEKEEGDTLKDYALSTTDIFQQIGKSGFYEAYARSQMGDIMVAYEKDNVGHARMLALDPIVIRKANGSIDATMSYFLTHEQGDGLYERGDTNSSWRIHYKYTFAQLADPNAAGLTGSSGYYLPITMKAFHDAKISASGSIASSGSIVTGNNPLKYAMNASYRILSATMVIKDADGNEVYHQTRFQGTSSVQSRRRAAPGGIPLYTSDVFQDCCNNLIQGQTYYVTLSGTTYSGITEVKMNNYKIVYDPAA